MILFYLLFISSTVFGQESSATDKVDDFCNTDQFDQIEKSADEIDDLRAERDNEFTNNWKDIIEYLRDPADNGDELFDTFMASAILLLIFMVLVIISIIIFICLCCGKYKTNEPQKTCVVLSWFFFILFIALFIIILVFLGLSQ